MGAPVDVVVGGGVHEETGLVAMAIRTSRSCRWGGGVGIPLCMPY